MSVPADDPVRPPQSDEGFTLVEILVALVIFSIVASATMFGLTTALHTSRSNESRVVAANLASRQIEIMRGVDANDIDQGYTTQDIVIDGDPYTIEQWAELDTQTGSGTACAGSTGRAAFKRITVQVTWPNMGGVQPVRSDTVKALPITGVEADRGVVTVKVENKEGEPVASHDITLLKGSAAYAAASTRADGCVVFADVEPGVDYYVVIDENGYVDKDGNERALSDAITVIGGFVTKYPGFRYDKSATMVATVRMPAGMPAAPGGYPLALAGTLFDGGLATVRECPTATPCWTGTDAGPYTVAKLFPAREGYTAWLGSCATAKPASGAAVTVSSGATTAVSLPPLGGVKALAKELDPGRGGDDDDRGSYVSRSLVAVNADCPSEFYEFPTMTGASEADPAPLALPAGKWRISDSRDNASNPKKSSVVTVRAGEVERTTVTFQ